jgi:hypothetical protein
MKRCASGGCFRERSGGSEGGKPAQSYSGELRCAYRASSAFSFEADTLPAECQYELQSGMA